MTTHRLDAGGDTVHWGYFDAALKPLLTVEPGDTVVMSSVSGSPVQLPPPDSGFTVPKALIDVHARVPQKLGPHMMTGPVAVRGAKAGQVLEVRIKAIELHYDWGYNMSRPLVGALPDDFDHVHLMHIALDRTRMIGQFAPGVDVPLHPFFGSMGVAPPPSFGRYDSAPPTIIGGNMDNRMLVAGTSLFLPVFNPGALFQVGDGHAAQGNGEVDITALETSLTGTLQFILHKGQKSIYPRAETPDAYIAMGFDDDLSNATRKALRNMIDFLVAEKGMTRDDAYMLVSVAGDVEVTELVDRNKGVHVVLPKRVFTAK